MLTLDILKDISIVIAGAIALITFVTGTMEYRRRGKQERAETFVHMRRRFQESPTFRHILDLVTTDDPTLANISIQDRRNLVGFLEEVGLLVNSGLLKPEVARLMFGWYVELVDQSQHFWTGLEPDSDYWHLFRRFAERMRSLKGRPPAPDEHMNF